MISKIYVFIIHTCMNKILPIAIGIKIRYKILIRFNPLNS